MICQTTSQQIHWEAEKNWLNKYEKWMAIEKFFEIA
jgi:hypothetical protein